MNGRETRLGLRDHVHFLKSEIRCRRLSSLESELPGGQHRSVRGHTMVPLMVIIP